MVQRDDFAFAGLKKGVDRANWEWYEVDLHAVLGWEADEDKAIAVLGRMVRLTREGVALEADENGGRLMRKGLGIVTAGTDDAEKLGMGELSAYREVAAMAKYFGADRPDIQFAVKEACRGMAAPSEADMKRVKFDSP